MAAAAAGRGKEVRPVWTYWSDLYFNCGENICLLGLEYCEDVSDTGYNQTWQQAYSSSEGSSSARHRT